MRRLGSAGCAFAFHRLSSGAAASTPGDNLAGMRQEYSDQHKLDNPGKDPLDLFRLWFAQVGTGYHNTSSPFLIYTYLIRPRPAECWSRTPCVYPHAQRINRVPASCCSKNSTTSTATLPRLVFATPDCLSVASAVGSSGSPITNLGRHRTSMRIPMRR